MINPMRTKEFSRTLELVFSTVISKSTQFFLLMYLSIFKTQDEFGIFIEFSLYTEILAIVLAHGANSAILKGNISKDISLNLTISMFFVATLSCILMLSFPLFTFKDFGDLKIYILIASPVIAINSIYRSATISEKKLNLYARSLRLSNILLLAYPIWDFLIATLSIFDALIFIIASNLISITIIGYYPKKIWQALGFKNVKNYLVSSLPFFARNNLGSMTKNMGLFNISFSESVSSLSGYGLISKIADQLGQFLSLLTIQFVPELRDALENNKSTDIKRYLQIIAKATICFLIISIVSCVAIFYGITIINPEAWLLEFRHESIILILAVGFGFIKSNLVSWEFLKYGPTGKIIIIVEICVLLIAFFTYSFLYNTLDTLGVAIAYLLIQIVQLMINSLLFVFFWNKRACADR